MSKISDGKYENIDLYYNDMICFQNSLKFLSKIKKVNNKKYKFKNNILDDDYSEIYLTSLLLKNNE